MTDRSIQNRYLEDNFNTFVEQLSQWLAIPSISTLPAHQKDVRRAAEWARTKLTAIGFPEVRVIQTSGHPMVYAECSNKSKQPTLLVYGHYDVQPIDPLDEWESYPFTPDIRNNNIYGRGASDDKGQIMLVLAALESWFKTTGTPPINVKVLLEGEEEAGSSAIKEYVTRNSKQLEADVTLICDTHMVDEKKPSIITSLRGIIYTEVEITGAKSDLHSGRYGGVAPNPLHALCVLISRIKGEDGSINIPELASAIPAPTAKERSWLTEDPLKIEKTFVSEMGIKEAAGETGYPFLERLGLRPTFELHGIRGGFIEEGAKTVIPAKVVAKLSLRLPATVDPQDAFNWLGAAVEKNIPAGYQVKLRSIHSGKGVSADPDNPYIQAAAQALEKEYGAPPVFMRHGGSIPIAALFDQLLSIPTVLMGFGLSDDAIHAPNEKFSLEQLRKGMRTVTDFIGRLERFH